MSESLLLPRHAAAQVQQGAYGLVTDEAGRLLVVESEAGRCYLPGGRIEPGERAQGALIREIAEECGWSAEILAFVSQAEQRIFDGAVQLRASYWRARLVKRLALRPEHACIWMSPAGALACLHRPGDREAVGEPAEF